nr:hypothetical protein [Tanacetum cinerariifolium]
MVHKQIEENNVRQQAIMNLAMQFEKESIAKDNLRKAYEECNDISSCLRLLVVVGQLSPHRVATTASQIVELAVKPILGEIAMVHKQIEENNVRQQAIMNLAVQFEKESIAKDNLRKAYEECNDIS